MDINSFLAAQSTKKYPGNAQLMIENNKFVQVNYVKPEFG